MPIWMECSARHIAGGPRPSRLQVDWKWYNTEHETADGSMNEKKTDCPRLERDFLEWNIPEEVLADLLKDRTTVRNLIWATDDYAGRGKGFAAGNIGSSRM